MEGGKGAPACNADISVLDSLALELKMRGGSQRTLRMSKVVVVAEEKD